MGGEAAVKPIGGEAAGLHSQGAALAACLPPLLVAAERVAATVLQGMHGRRRTGAGDSFWQFRRYQPGDPATAIDWRQSAKCDPLYVRETEWAAAQSVWLWADPSPSMRWTADPSRQTKFYRACLLVLAAASLLLRGGEQVGRLGGAEPPRMGRGVLPALAAGLLEQAPPSQPDGLPDVLLPRHATLLLLSDFLVDLNALDRVVRHWAGGGVRGHLVQVVDPAEESLPYQGRVRFAGLEGETELLVPEASSLREAYRERMADHQAGLAAIAGAVGWSFSRHHTHLPATAALTAIYSAITNR